MKRSVQVFVPIIFALLVVFQQAAMSEVMISLKNGRDIIADGCSDSKDKIVCVKMGGTFEVEKKDILRVSGIRTEKKLSGEDSVEASGEVKKDGISEKKMLTEDRGQEKEISEAREKRKAVRGTDPVAEKRIEEIHERKVQLGAEAEKLNIEKQQLKEEMQKAPNMLTKEQFDALNKRNIEFESRIKRFNEEVNNLNKEEQAIIQGLTGNSETVK